MTLVIILCGDEHPKHDEGAGHLPEEFAVCVGHTRYDTIDKAGQKVLA